MMQNCACYLTKLGLKQCAESAQNGKILPLWAKLTQAKPPFFALLHIVNILLL